MSVEDDQWTGDPHVDRANLIRRNMQEHADRRQPHRLTEEELIKLEMGDPSGGELALAIVAFFGACALLLILMVIIF